jgi:hypothetical protein
MCQAILAACLTCVTKLVQVGARKKKKKKKKKKNKAWNRAPFEGPFPNAGDTVGASAAEAASAVSESSRPPTRDQIDHWAEPIIELLEQEWADEAAAGDIRDQALRDQIQALEIAEHPDIDDDESVASTHLVEDQPEAEFFSGRIHKILKRTDDYMIVELLCDDGEVRVIRLDRSTMQQPPPQHSPG